MRTQAGLILVGIQRELVLGGSEFDRPAVVEALGREGIPVVGPRELIHGGRKLFRCLLK